MMLNSNDPNLYNIETGIYSNFDEVGNVLLEKIGISIFHINIRSLNKNFDNLKLQINATNKPPDVIICTETFEISSENYFQIDNYDMYHVNSGINRNDGSCIYVKHDIPHSNASVDIGRLKAIFTKINTNSGEIYLTSLYRPHETSKRNFILDLQKYLSDNSLLENHFFLGDINIDILNIDENSNHYYNNFNELGFRSYINIPTRVALNSATCIDHIFGKIKKNIDIIPIVLDLDLTDHRATMIFLDLNIERIIKPAKNPSMINYAKLSLLASGLNWEGIYETSDVNISVTNIINQIESLISSSTQQIKRNNKNNVARKDWMSKGLIKSCKVKNDLYKLFKQNPNNEIIKNNYLRYKNKLTRLIKTTKNNYHNDLLTKISDDSRKLWNFVNDKIDKKKVNKPIVQIFSSTENKIIKNEKEIADIFNKFFTNVGPDMANNIRQTNESYRVDETKTTLMNSIFLTPTTETEVLNIIRAMNSNKSSGVDNISCKVVKTIAGYISKPLVYIINKSIETSIFPDHFKKAEVIPIFKAGDADNPTNYRPISLIPSLAKIYEKILKIRLDDFIQTFGIINPMQFGFQRQKKLKMLSHLLLIVSVMQLTKVNHVFPFFWISRKLLTQSTMIYYYKN